MSKLRMPLNENDHYQGNQDSKVTLVEYGDYQCQHCKIAHSLVGRLLKEFEGELLFVFRNFPLQEAHPVAMMAALAAEAASLQGKFWEMHDKIYEDQENLDGNALLSYAEELNLDLHDFADNWKSNELLSKVEKDFEGGIHSGVNGTPTFFINGDRLNNYDETYESLRDAVRRAF